MFNAERSRHAGNLRRRVGSAARPALHPRFDAGSVLTSSTRRPPSASAMAEAHASEVLPTPPLPVKKRKRVALLSKTLIESPDVAGDVLLVLRVPGVFTKNHFYLESDGSPSGQQPPEAMAARNPSTIFSSVRSPETRAFTPVLTMATTPGTDICAAMSL